ncbi:hypothetical protein AB1399_07925, partial [Hydrogenibacillus schlegelii]|uniref:hypothetical protein n=1 Tax=Hydrogenibacillus schlegelii TaxID=1484 RepID=UPI0034A0A86C
NRMTFAEFFGPPEDSDLGQHVHRANDKTVVATAIIPAKTIAVGHRRSAMPKPPHTSSNKKIHLVTRCKGYPMRKVRYRVRNQVTMPRTTEASAAPARVSK